MPATTIDRLKIYAPLPYVVVSSASYRRLSMEKDKIEKNSYTNIKDSYDDDSGQEKCRKEKTILQCSPELTRKVIYHLCDYVTIIMTYHVFVSSKEGRG